MDSIIFMLVLFFGARWLNNRMKQMATQKPAQKSGSGQAARPQPTALEIFGSMMGIEEPKALVQAAPKAPAATFFEGESMERNDMPGRVLIEPRSMAYEGSTSSLEGVDICDPSLHHDRIIFSDVSDPMEVPREIAALPLSLAMDAMMQGIVMSEILTRPSARKWGRR